MDLGDLITRQSVFCCLQTANKKQALEELALAASSLTGISSKDLFTSILQRERLGSTALGRGVAVPHVHVHGLERTVCLFAKLASPVNFDAPDKHPVDLLFLLLSPDHASGDHLKSLARISRLVRDTGTIERLRAAKDADGLWRVLSPHNPINPHKKTNAAA